MSFSPAYAALPSRAVVGGAPGIPPDLRRCIRRACTTFLGALKRVQEPLSSFDLFQIPDQLVGHHSDSKPVRLSVASALRFHAPNHGEAAWKRRSTNPGTREEHRAEKFRTLTTELFGAAA